MLVVGGCRLGFDEVGAATDARTTGPGLDVAPPVAGAVYATAEDMLYTVDPASGNATPIGTLACATGVGDLALSRDGELLLVAGMKLYAVDPATAACTERATITNTPVPIVGVAFLPDGRLLGGTGAKPGKLFQIDPQTGAGVDLGSYSGGYYSRGDLAWTGSRLVGTVTQDGGGDWFAAFEIAEGEAEIRGTTSTFTGLVATGTQLFGFAPDGTIAELDVQTGAVLATTAAGHAWTGVALVPP